MAVRTYKSNIQNMSRIHESSAAIFYIHWLIVILWGYGLVNIIPKRVACTETLIFKNINTFASLLWVCGFPLLLLYFVTHQFRCVFLLFLCFVGEYHTCVKTSSSSSSKIIKEKKKTAIIHLIRCPDVYILFSLGELNAMFNQSPVAQM